MFDKIVAILVIVAAIIGLVFFLRKQQKEDPCGSCRDCALRDQCNKPQKK